MIRIFALAAAVVIFTGVTAQAQCVGGQCGANGIGFGWPGRYQSAGSFRSFDYHLGLFPPSIDLSIVQQNQSSFARVRRPRRWATYIPQQQLIIVSPQAAPPRFGYSLNVW
jgi:hypothetical protein